MFAEMPVASLYLMIVGGLATALAMAALRRDWTWVLALGLPLVAAVERAGLPAALFGWSCALYAIMLMLVAGIWAVRTVGWPVVGLVAGALAYAGLSSMPAAASLGDPAPLSWHRPPAFGVELAGMLGRLADDPRYAAE